MSAQKRLYTRLLLVTDHRVALDFGDTDTVQHQHWKTKDGQLRFQPVLRRDKKASCQPARKRARTTEKVALLLTRVKCGQRTMVHVRLGTVGAANQQKILLLAPNCSREVTVFDDIRVTSGSITLQIVAQGYTEPPAGSDFRLSLQKARLEGTLCDVQLQVGDATLPAHRLILTARCPVLYKMLTGDNAVDSFDLLANCSRDAAEMFLEFLYTDRINDWQDQLTSPVVWDHVACRSTEVELMKLAAVYAVPELTAACAERLLMCTAPYALMVLHLAGLAEIIGEPLRRRLTSYVLGSMTDLIRSEAWDEFDAAYPHVVDSMLAIKDPDVRSAPAKVSGVGPNSGIGLCLYSSRHDDALCDLKLVVNGLELPAHRLVLAARSPVLYKMLTGSFQEAAEGRVDLVDVSQDAAEKFLEFLYTDKVQVIKGVETELLYLADKYLVPELCDHVQQRVRQYGAQAALAVLHDAGLSGVLKRPLRRHLSMTVVKNMARLADTQDWAEFQTTYSVLAYSMLGYIDYEKKCFEIIL